LLAAAEAVAFAVAVHDPRASAPYGRDRHGRAVAKSDSWLLAAPSGESRFATRIRLYAHLFHELRLRRAEQAATPTERRVFTRACGSQGEAIRAHIRPVMRVLRLQKPDQHYVVVELSIARPGPPLEGPAKGRAQPRFGERPSGVEIRLIVL